jgi:hypothetical protein
MDPVLNKIAHNALWFTASVDARKALSSALQSKNETAVEKATRTALNHIENQKVRKRLESYLSR